MIPLKLISFSHHSTPVAIRERLRPEPGDFAALLKGEAELFLLTTCNRTEIYFCGLEPAAIYDQLHWLSGLSVTELAGYGVLYEGASACRQLFRVVAGLDSQVLGETQINGQAKQAYRAASQQAMTGVYLNKALHRAFAAAKRVHSETALGRYPVSIASEAVELAGRIFGALAKHPALIIGAGEMATLAARRLYDRGVRQLKILNRTPENACDLAHELCASLGGLGELEPALECHDIVIAAAGADEALIEAELLQTVMRRRKHRPLLIVDIALPRNVAPCQIYNCYLYDLDGLSRSVDANKTSRAQEVAGAEAIIDAEVADYATWCASLSANPTIAALFELTEDLITEQLDASRLAPEEREALHEALRKFARRLTHRPVSFLRDNPDSQNCDTIRRIFKLDEDYQDRFARQRACPGSGRDS